MRVFVRPVAGGRGIPLTDDTTEVQSHPRWSPTGAGFCSSSGGGVVSAPAAGGAETPEVPPARSGPVISAAYSPDGKRIAYVVGDSLFLRESRGDSPPLPGSSRRTAALGVPAGSTSHAPAATPSP